MSDLGTPISPNQCDGCKAGIPITWSSWTKDSTPIPLHRMGGEVYPDYMTCEAEKYGR